MKILGIKWYYMVLYGTIWHYMVLHGLRGSANHCDLLQSLLISLQFWLLHFWLIPTSQSHLHYFPELLVGVIFLFISPKYILFLNVFFFYVSYMFRALFCLFPQLVLNMPYILAVLDLLLSSFSTLELLLAPVSSLSSNLS